MVKTHITLSIDSRVKSKAKEILDKRGVKLSFFVEQFLRNFIEKESKLEN